MPQMAQLRPYHVAIVGAGPSGYFAAAALLKAADQNLESGDQSGGRDVAVDMLEMLPTPWGLVRSGVAPDHPKIKSISAQFEKIAADPRFRFFGNITVGEHVQSAELAEHYDAVIYAIGAQSDRPLNIPGEELPGSIAAVDFVGWYNAHPHFEEMAPDLAGTRAVVVGNGNVALDVARILVADPKLLSETDIADHALDSLHGQGVEEVVIIGRRGPLQATFTTLELRELADLESMTDVDVVVDPADFDAITEEDLEAAGKTVKQNVKVMRGYADTAPKNAKRRIVFRFRTSPVEIKGDGSGRGDRAGQQRVGHRRGRTGGRQGHRRTRGTARAVGDPRRRLSRRGHAGPAVRRELGHHSAHRRPDRRQPQRVRRRLDQARPVGRDREQQEGFRRHRRHPAGRPRRRPEREVGADYSDELVEWLVSRQPALVTDDHWRLIDAHERAAGEPSGRPRVKLTSVAELLRVGHA